MKFSRRLLGAALAFLATVTQAKPSAEPDYRSRADVQAFAQTMEAEHGIPAGEILASLAGVERDDQVIRLITPPTRPGVRSWARYRARFIEPVRIREGLAFWETYQTPLRQASQQFGVPEEIILGILGVETIFGRNTGNFTLVSALATLAFDYPPRAELFRKELTNLYLLAREQGVPATQFQGSFAGALGYPQFLPSSVRSFAVDFDGDGHVDLEQSPADAIGSIAHYLKVHGWEAGGPVALRAQLAAEAPAELLAADIVPTFLPDELVRHGVRPAAHEGYPQKAALIELVTPNATSEYWLGYQNFYVITRYNRSSFYAMAVFQLAEALRERRARGAAPSTGTK
ncbi:MAG: lytic murein transglycosylase B [Zoogloeaceae bacterium]|nr:lytic murein transglycosylase B [Zoogloeaceae bacterium]